MKHLKKNFKIEINPKGTGYTIFYFNKKIEKVSCSVGNKILIKPYTNCANRSLNNILKGNIPNYLKDLLKRIHKQNS